MSRKSLTLAIAAALSIGTLALASTEASARSFGGGGGMHASGGFHTAPRSVGVMRPGLVTGLRIPGKVTGIKIPGHPGKITGIWIKPHHHHHWHWRYGWWRRGLWVAPVIATGGVATYAATAPSTNRCTCLTKDYTPQGAVVFKDVCTNEMAMNPPFNASPAADVAPQMPQQPMQQGYLQPQAQ